MAEADWKYLQYNIENGQKRTSDGPSGGPSSLADLDDTSISNPSNGQILGYDGTEGKWKNVAAPVGSVTDVTLDGNTVVNGQGVAVLTTPNVNDLKDTNISSPSSGQTLQYNATTQKWENTTPASGGNVDDVKVNGASVVTNKVANITSYKEVTQAQYEALPDTKLNDGVLYAIKDGGEAIEGYPPLIYSDEERQVGVWRDGKPLYQKTIKYNKSDLVSGNNVIQHGLSNIDEFTDIRSVVASGSGSSISFASLPRVAGTNTTYQVRIYDVTSSKFELGIGSGIYTNLNYVIATFWYTKTTDTPGSGTWTTQGALAHHYSTDEHIIGTWIDRKPIYEKTYDNLSISLSMSSWVVTSIDCSHISKSINGFAIDNYGQCHPVEVGLTSEHKIALRGGGNTANYLTVQYTKITD